jgi:phosphoglycolate phosphatase
MTAIRLAVFDCDGTLVDSAHNIVACMAAAFAVHGLPAPLDPAVRRVVGLSLETAMAALVPQADAALHLRLADSYKAAFFELRSQPDHSEPLYPGAMAAIEALGAAGFLLGVATGKSQRGLRAVLERHGLLHRFVTLQTADVAAGKPHPEMLHRAMAETGADRLDTVMIGDTSYDIQMAANAEVAGIGVAWGYHPPGELSACGAQAIAEDFAGLPALVFGAVKPR